MSLATILTTVRYYTQADAYYYTVDNRPLTDLATRDTEISNEVERRTIAVDITGASTATINQAPAGWIVATNGVGDYTITHAIGNTSYIGIAGIVGATPGSATITARTNTTIQVKTFNLAGAATHLRFNLLVTGF